MPQQKGFTLLELLIVIVIIAILAVALIFVLDPAETLKKARDTQRISDLATMKTAIGIYTTSTSSPRMAPNTNGPCKTGSGGGSYAAGDIIYYSYPSSTPGARITDNTLDGGTGGTPTSTQVANAAVSNTDSTGWLPIDLESITGGSSISNLPIDPTNTIADLAAVTSTDLVYRYACNATSLTYEIDAQLESSTFTTSPDDKRQKDGGNSILFYEVGTNLKILGVSGDF